MRRFLLLLFVCSPDVLSQGWEWQNPWPQGNTLNAVQALAEETIVCVGDASTFVKTTDSGLTWSVQHFISGSSALRGVCFVNENVGMVVGDDGTLLRTLDGGNSWNAINSPTSADLWDVWFSNVTTGIVIGGTGTIFRTTDGGTSWGEGPVEITSSLNGLCFVNQNIGTIVGSGGVIFRTVDGGATWASQESGTTSTLNDVFFTDSNTGAAVGNGGTILGTTDGGSTWSSQISGTEEPLLGVSLANGREGVAVGLVREIFSTKDGGTTWKGFDVFPQNYLSLTFTDVCFQQSGLGYCVGSSGLILQTTDAGVSWQELSQGHVTSATVLGLSFPNGEMGIGVGHSGGYAHIPNIFLTTDRGLSWAIHFVPGNFNAIASSDIEHATAVGEYGTYGFIQRTTNHGVTWSYMYTTGFMNGVHFGDSLNGLAVGDNGAVFRTSNGGITWDNLPSGTTTHLLGVYMIDNNLAVAVGGKFDTYGVLRTTNGGGTWELITIPVRSIMNAVKFVGSSFGIAVGSDGAIIRTTNAGISWTSQMSGTSNNLTDVAFNSDGSVGYAVGGVILRTTDSGLTWATEQSPGGGYSVAATGDSGWTIGGPNGSILHKEEVTATPLITGERHLSPGRRVIEIQGSPASISENFPNPFNPSTTIRYALNLDMHVTLNVYNLVGELVITLVDRDETAGNKEVVWDGKDALGVSVASGIYIYRITTGGFTDSKRMLLLK